MDPTKYIGRIKEQVELENAARRNFAKNWQKLTEPELLKFYNQTEVARIVAQQFKDNEGTTLRPYVYSGHGDSFFVSKDMYKSLLATCRCGRPHTGIHVLKCLQKPVAQHEAVKLGKTCEEHSKTQETSLKTKNQPKVKNYNLPVTSNAFYGWPQKPPSYRKIEQSMKYTSPIYTMPGHRIGSAPYKVLFLG